MPILGMTYKKLSAERTKGLTPDTKIETRPEIKDLKATSISGFGDALPALDISFTYESTFEPGVAKITLEGSVLYATKEAEKIAEGWKKGNAIPDGLKIEVLNHILQKGSIQALLLSDALQLPPVIRLPRVQITPPAEKQRGSNIQFCIKGIGIVYEISYKVLGRSNGR